MAGRLLKDLPSLSTRKRLQFAFLLGRPDGTLYSRLGVNSPEQGDLFPSPVYRKYRTAERMEIQARRYVCAKPMEETELRGLP